MIFEIKINNISELSSVSKDIIPYIIKRPVVAFYGKMGAGKQHLLKRCVKK